METKKSKKKILIIGPPKSGKLSLVKALTSSLPPELNDESNSHAGLTHSITLTTRYFSTEAGIWIDEIPEDSEAWLEEYLSEEATPVLQSLAAVIFTVSAGSEPDRDVDILRKLNERGEEVEWDATSLVVGKKYPGGEAYSTVSSYCEEYPLEFINLNESGENEFGGTSDAISH
jgi:GTPase SAR1 family protein